jgi:hypothetical protein
MQAHLHAHEVELLQTKLVAQQLATEHAELEKAALETQLRADKNCRARLVVETQLVVQDSAQPGAIAAVALILPSQVRTT